MLKDTTRSEWFEDFEAAARRPLAQRWRYAFIRTYKPVMDDAKFRAFDTICLSTVAGTTDALWSPRCGN